MAPLEKEFIFPSEESAPVYLHEFLYPLMQGYDFVAMDVDAELGGSDQLFNMLAGRTLTKAMKQKEGYVITLKLLTNDEGKKMSKSEGGFVALSDAPEDMYGKIMAMDDSMILPYFELLTNVSMEEIAGMRVAMQQGMNPRDAKARLARTVVTMFHDEAAADKAQAHFETVFQKHESPEEMQSFVFAEPQPIIEALESTALVESKSEARRLIEQKAIKIDGTVVTSLDQTVVGTAEGVVLQRGKRRFVKLINTGG